MTSANRPPPAFEVRVHPDRDVVRVVPVGELDLATVDQLRSELDGLTSAGFKQVVLDLRELEFIDSSGLMFVLDTDARARQDGFDFALIEGPQAIQRIFAMSGVVDRLPFRAQ